MTLSATKKLGIKREGIVSLIVSRMYLTGTRVSRGDWLGKPANIKVENNGALVYVGSSLTVQNPLFLVHKL